MALFGSKKKEHALKKVRPTVVRTQNVAKEIFNIAKSYDTDPEQLDFNLLGVQTYTRLVKDSKESEWEEVQADKLYELDDTTLLNPEYQIKQTYEIEIFSKLKDGDYLEKEFKSAVGANATKCKVYLSVAAGSKLTYDEKLEHNLKLLINKKKIRAGILIGIFDEMVDDFISKLSASARINSVYEFQKAQTYLIAEGFEPTATINDALILHYENNKDVDENQKVDYSSRGFIQSVKQDELLIEYVKPKNGKYGRNCRGEFIQPTEPIVANEPTFNVEDTIKVEETPESIKYIAKENGYIAYEDNKYIIKQDVDLSEISFKTTGSISSGVDSDVNISVKESDAVKDAIGTGMVVEVTEIDIDGNVGSNARVIAKKATIGGQTHQSAFVKADDLDINVHKGKAEGENIHITRLEHGTAKGKNIKVTQALGGSLFAKNINIEICTSHVKATATHLIEIEKLHGSENTFIIDPMLSDDVQKNAQDNEETIKQLEIEIRDLKKEAEQYSKMVKDGMGAFLDIKKRLIHYKKNGVKMPEAFVKKYKQFQTIQNHLKKTEDTLLEKQDRLNLLSAKSSTFQDNIFEARVINRGEWIGYNEIKFKLIDPPMELVYKPAENSEAKIFGIKESEDGEFSISALIE
ncbi:flagellar assembly protein A [Sulfurimonas sp.]|uniref:flagellar assembly protein A n=1 Tax=Sulfurimonas sp. TaxID=2022749 RepID=UPI003D14E4D3